MKRVKFRFESEVEVAKPIVAWLVSDGWTVYQEVVCLGNACDIVAVRGPLIWAIEVKKAMSLALIDQGIFWKNYAHQASVAAPRFGTRETNCVPVILRRLGLGQIGIDEYGCINERVQPEFRRKILPDLKKSLRPECMTGDVPAGTSGGGRFTPFRITALRLKEHVEANPGITMKDAVAAIKHHYSTQTSARVSLVLQIQKGTIPGVEIRMEGKAVRLYPSQNTGM